MHLAWKTLLLRAHLVSHTFIFVYISFFMPFPPISNPSILYFFFHAFSANFKSVNIHFFAARTPRWSCGRTWSSTVVPAPAPTTAARPSSRWCRPTCATATSGRGGPAGSAPRLRRGSSSRVAWLTRPPAWPRRSDSWGGLVSCVRQIYIVVLSLSKSVILKVLTRFWHFLKVSYLKFWHCCSDAFKRVSYLKFWQGSDTF